MTRLIFIRHGQSEANAQNRFAGQTNVPLTELGKAQAKCAAEYIVKREKIDKIYSSDLQRAHNTALPVSELTGIPINDATELREICAGIWEGRLANEIEVEYEKGRGIITIPEGTTALHCGKLLKAGKHDF